MHRLALGLVLVPLVLTLAPPHTFADKTGVQTRPLDWSLVYDVDAPFQEGMLWPDRLIVHFAPDAIPTVLPGKDGDEVRTDQLALDGLNRRFGVRNLERLFPPVSEARKAAQPEGRDRLWIVDFDGSHRLADVADAYRALPGVTQVEPVGVHQLTANVPNDPSLQDWIRNPGLGGGDIRAIAAWYHAVGDPDVVIAVADSGVDWRHPDLGGTGPDYIDGSIWINEAEWNGIPGVDDDGNFRADDIRGWDFVTGITTGEQNPPQDTQTPDNDPMDYDGHGTGVAGCAAAITNNGIGGAGSSFGCSVMALRIGWLPDGSDIGVVRMDFAAQALDYARLSGARVFNASWGSSNNGGIAAAANAAVAANVVIVTAAGNANDEIASYLASRNDVLAVAATNLNDGKAGFSSYGTWVDISAPGVGTYTTAYDRFTDSSTYNSPNGTSFSSPIVAGIAGFIISSFPGNTAAQTRNKIKASHDDIDDINPTYAGKLGNGRVNMAKIFDNPKWLVPDQLDTWVDAFNVAEPGDEIAVRGGVTILDRLTPPSSSKPLQILGGYDATFTTRDPVGNKTILENPSGGPTLLVNLPTDNLTTIDGFVITGGSAQLSSFEPDNGYFGGGVLVRGGADPVLSNLLVQGNSAGNGINQNSGGGGIAVLNASPTFRDVEVTGNSAAKGAGIYVYQGNPVFENVDIHDNPNQSPAGSDADGGGVYIVDTNSANSGSVRFTGGAIRNHTTDGSGGGLYALNSDVTLDGVEVSGNSSVDTGGGVHITGGTYTGTGNVFRDNRILPGNSKSGGGLFVGAAVSASISGGRFEGNEAGFAGGGMSLENVPTASVEQTFLIANTAAFFGSGVNVTAAGTFGFTSNTVADNFGASAGGNGVYVVGSAATVASNIFASNGGGGTSIADGYACSGGTATFTCNLVFANEAGNYGGCPDPTGTDGNALGAPLFCDRDAGDYDVTTDSPAAAAQSGCGDIGAGSPTCDPKLGVVLDPPGPGTPSVPLALELGANRPNPFNPRTVIGFAVPAPGRVKLTIHDLRGRLVTVLTDEVLEAGRYSVEWDGRDAAGQTVASGTYFYSVEHDLSRRVRKLQLLK